MARAAVVIAAVGLTYIAYLFGLACVVLAQRIPGEADWFVGGASLESRVFAFSCWYGLVPLGAILALVIVFARFGGKGCARRAAVAILVVGFPFAAIAYSVWYRIGW